MNDFMLKLGGFLRQYGAWIVLGLAAAGGTAILLFGK